MNSRVLLGRRERFICPKDINRDGSDVKRRTPTSISVSDGLDELSYFDLLFESTFETEVIGASYPSIISPLNGDERPTLWVPGVEMSACS